MVHPENSGNFMKDQNVLSPVYFIVNKYFSMSVMKLDLVDSNLAEFRPYSPNSMYCIQLNLIFGPPECVANRRSLRIRFSKLVGRVRVLSVPARRLGVLI